VLQSVERIFGQLLGLLLVLELDGLAVFLVPSLFLALGAVHNCVVAVLLQQGERASLSSAGKQAHSQGRLGCGYLRVGFDFDVVGTEMAAHAKQEDAGGEVLPNLLLLCIVANATGDVDATTATPNVVGHFKSANIPSVGALEIKKKKKRAALPDYQYAFVDVFRSLPQGVRSNEFVESALMRVSKNARGVEKRGRMRRSRLLTYIFRVIVRGIILVRSLTLGHLGGQKFLFSSSSCLYCSLGGNRPRGKCGAENEQLGGWQGAGQGGKGSWRLFGEEEFEWDHSKLPLDVSKWECFKCGEECGE